MSAGIKCGNYYWIKLIGADEDHIRAWEPAYRFCSGRNTDVWLVIATSEDIPDERVAEVGPRLEPPR